MPIGTCTAAPKFAASAPSNRNLEIVQVKGGTTYVVRDITDILHPVNVGTFVASHVSPQVVGPQDVSFIDASGLERMRLGGSSRTLVSTGASLFAWSPDGTTLAYVDGNEQFHLASGGRDCVIDSMPTTPYGYGCESQTCADEWEFRMSYSPDGALITLIQWPPGQFRIWTSQGKVVKASSAASGNPTLSPTMGVWSGTGFYFRDAKGVEVLRSGVQSLVLPGVSWTRPHASPAGGQIVYETRDAAGTAFVNLLDTASGKSRQLVKSRSEPAFLNSHLIWYREERPCLPADKCFAGPTTPTGRTFIYDLQDGTETESLIASVYDVWPHPA